MLKLLGIRGEPDGNRTRNPQIERTAGPRPRLSTWGCRFVVPETTQLDRQPVSTGGRPLVCQAAAVSSGGVPAGHRRNREPITAHLRLLVPGVYARRSL